MNTSSWSKEKKQWILTIDKLFCDLFGSDFLPYKYNKDKGTGVDESTVSSLVEYSHDQWEKNYMPLDGNMMEELSSQQENGCPENQNDMANETSEQKKVSKKLAFHEQTQSSKKEKKNTLAETSSGSTSPSSCTDEIIIIQDDESEDQMQTSSNGDDNSHQGSQLLSSMSTAKTRAELAALASLIPPVHSSFLDSSCTEVTSDCVVYTDPYCLTQRPCENIVITAEKLLSDQRQKGSNPTGVVIKGIGHFS